MVNYSKLLLLSKELEKLGLHIEYIPDDCKIIINDTYELILAKELNEDNS